jgi:hypothetical protein
VSWLVALVVEQHDQFVFLVVRKCVFVHGTLGIGGL